MTIEEHIAPTTAKDDAMAAKATTQSTITNGQIGQICDRLMTKLRESGLPTDAVQSVLSEPGGAFIDEMFATFQKCVEAISNLIVRTVKVNVNRTPQEALDATGRTQYTDRKVVDRMPKALVSEIEIVFFKPDLSGCGGFISDDDLEKEYELRGLKPVGPVSLAALNEADHAITGNSARSGERGGGPLCILKVRVDNEHRVMALYHRNQYPYTRSILDHGLR